ncbi:lipopolysaccharide biosynthesis protein [Chryseobacterium sp. MYb7]|uniref:lipopolysaccharide biosynthesis protein n=1 Tax=Chryseobacterium sp. MYb7 TaxID=1827290 RepID=UPI0013FE43B9|nr:polysaccharide biosynthesis C-terminal domain-containing protein [Chryseobacterium sp. MYb7]
MSSQAIKYSFISYIGYIIGIISTIFLYSSELEFYGTLRYILATSLLLSSFFSLGLNATIIKLYNELTNKGFINSFICLSLIVIIVFISLNYFTFDLLKEFFFTFGGANFWNYMNFIFPIICLYSLNSVIYSFLANFYITAIPNIFDSLLPKVNMIISFIYFLYYKDACGALLLFVILSFISTVILFLFMKKKTGLSFDFNVNFWKDNSIRKEVISFSSFSILNSFLYAIITQIGMVMLGESNDLKINGIYAVIYSIIGLINIPLLAVSKSSTPLISDFIDNENIRDLNSFYKKTSLSLFFIGSFLFLIIATNFDSFFSILNKGELVGHFNIICILGLALMIDLLTGINSNIINRSKHYKINTAFIIITALISLTVSFLLIIYYKLGIMGVAISTFISMLVFNGLKLFFNYKFLKIHPFSKKMLPILISIILVLFVSQNFIFFNKFYFLFINSISIIFLYGIINYCYKIIPIKDIYKFNNKT